MLDSEHAQKNEGCCQGRDLRPQIFSASVLWLEQSPLFGSNLCKSWKPQSMWIEAQLLFADTKITAGDETGRQGFYKCGSIVKRDVEILANALQVLSNLSRLTLMWSLFCKSDYAYTVRIPICVCNRDLNSSWNACSNICDVHLFDTSQKVINSTRTTAECTVISNTSSSTKRHRTVCYASIKVIVLVVVFFVRTVFSCLVTVFLCIPEWK